MRTLGPAALMLLAALLAFSLPFTYSDPSYGLLRTFSEEAGGINFRAYDIEVDGDGIYIVGASTPVTGDKAVSGSIPFLLILNPDHSLRCNLMFGFQNRDDGTVDSVASSVEANSTHVIVAGHFIAGGKSLALFVAAFDKSNCKLIAYHTNHLTTEHSASGPINQLGEGLDLAMDESGIYVLAGVTIFDAFRAKSSGFLLVKLNQYLQHVDHRYYYVRDAATDFAVSLALGSESVYILGGTGVDFMSKKPYASEIFILEVSKSSLDGLNVTLIQPIYAFSIAAEILVDENSDIYAVLTEEKPDARNNIAIIKLDSRMNVVWWQDYTLSFSYPDHSNPPPENVPSIFDFAVSAAVSGAKVFTGGYTLYTYSDGKDDSFALLHGIFLAVDGSNGEALYAFRVQGFDDIELPVRIFGLDGYNDCVYLAGGAGRYRLEYVFMNSFNLSKSLPTATPSAAHNTIELRPEDTKLTDSPWTPAFDIDQSERGTKEYGFYGVFCDASFVDSTTATLTIYETYTTTSTYTTTVEDTSYTTVTETSTRTTTVTSTSYTTATETLTSTQTTTLTSTSYTTSTQTITTTSTQTATTTSTHVTTSTSTGYTTITTTATQTTTVGATATFHTTVTTTSTYSITAEATTTRTRIKRVTETTLATTYSTRLVESTLYTTSQLLSTVFERVVSTVTSIVSFTTHVTETAPRPVQTTETKLLNTTIVITTTETRTPSGDYVPMPPWVFPLLLMPFPFVAVLARRRKYRMVIREGAAAPVSWRSGDPPVMDDAYLYPSVLSLRRGAIVEFVNRDSVEHVVVSQRGGERVFVSEPIKPGGKWSYRFMEPGIYYVVSSQKPFIGGMIRVGE